MNCCNQKFIQLGAPNCTVYFGSIRYIVFVDPEFIEANTFLEPNFNQIISESSGVFSPKIYDVETAKAESVFQEFSDGTRFFIRESVRTLNAVLPKATPSQLFSLKKLRCKRRLGVYLIDDSGYVLGWGNINPTDITNGKLYPIPIAPESIDPLFQFATDSTVQQVSISLQFEQGFDEGLLVVGANKVNPNDHIYAPVYINNLVVNLSLSFLSCRLLSPAGSINTVTLNNFDFESSIRFEGYNISSGLNFQLDLGLPTFDPFTEVLTFDIITVSNAIVGDTLLFKTFLGAKRPYGSTIEVHFANEVSVIAL